MHRTQETSLEALELANLPKRQQQVLEEIMNRGPMTDLELSAATDLPINIICGARNRLVEAGLIKDSGDRRISRWGRRNIVWRLRTASDRAADAAAIRQLNLL